MVTHYREDLAFIHDAGYGRLARAAARLILDDLHSRGIEHGTVMDLGCGSGLLAEPIAQAGFDLVGIDLSSAFVAMAKVRVPTGEFRVDSLLTAPLVPCVAAACVGECVSYLFDPAHSWEGVRNFFRRVFDALEPGGLFLLDLVTPGRVPGGGPHAFHNQGDGWVVLGTGTEADGIVTRSITTFRRVGELWRRGDETHIQRTLSIADSTEMLRQVGFAVEILSAYGDVTFPPGVVGFHARKPTSEN